MKSLKHHLVTCLVAMLGSLAGAGEAAVPAGQNGVPPGPGQTAQQEQEIVIQESTLKGASGDIRIWLYMPPGVTKPVPAVLIAPAGSPLFYGAELSDGDQDEHVPWVKKGYAVIAYDLEGVPEQMSKKEINKAIRKFQEANYGVADAKLALDYALAQEKGIDPKRVIAVGHSSAATLALLVAASDRRIAGCIAFSPAVDLDKQLAPQAKSTFSKPGSGFDRLVKEASPVNAISRLKCPVFLFHADDDEVVPAGPLGDFATALGKTNPKVTFKTVKSGGHYDSMINEGIPAAMQWANSLPAAK